MLVHSRGREVRKDNSTRSDELAYRLGFTRGKGYAVGHNEESGFRVLQLSPLELFIRKIEVLETELIENSDDVFMRLKEAFFLIEGECAAK